MNNVVFKFEIEPRLWKWDGRVFDASQFHHDCFYFDIDKRHLYAEITEIDVHKDSYGVDETYVTLDVDNPARPNDDLSDLPYGVIEQELIRYFDKTCSRKERQMLRQEMETGRYLKWSDEDRGGTIHIHMNLDNLKIDICSGSAPDTDSIVKLLWSDPSCQIFRDYAKTLKRANIWNVWRHDGMSSCTDWGIQFLDKNGIVRRTKTVLHSSSVDRLNEGLDAWIKDVYDLLWSFIMDGTYADATADEPKGHYHDWTDITKQVVSRRAEFLKDCWFPSSGFGDAPDISIPTDNPDDYVNYSDYRPTDESTTDSSEAE